MGEANANVLISEGHENKSYNIANDVNYSFQDMADILSELAKKKIIYTNPNQDSYIDSLKASGLPEHMAQIASGFSIAMRDGDFDLPGNDLKNLLGRKPIVIKFNLQQIFYINIGRAHVLTQFINANPVYSLLLT